jgi:hypothetical protein
MPEGNPALILWFVALLICGLVICGVLAVIALVGLFRKGDRPKLEQTDQARVADAAGHGLKKPAPDLIHRAYDY